LSNVDKFVDLCFIIVDCLQLKFILVLVLFNDYDCTIVYGIIILLLLSCLLLLLLLILLLL